MWVIGDKIAHGGTSEVHLCHKNDGKIHVVKKVDLNRASGCLVQDEIEILKSLNHPNVVKYVDGFKLENFHCVIMERCEGTDMMSFIRKRGKGLHQDELKLLFRQMVASVAYCHFNVIAHRDIKLGNFIYNEKTGKCTLVDFGCSCTRTSKVVPLLVGTKGYLAPEVFDSKLETSYNFFGADIWALGVCLYVLAYAKIPYASDKKPNRPIECHSTGDGLENLIKGMLQLEPGKRITIEDVTNHEWLK